MKKTSWKSKMIAALAAAALVVLGTACTSGEQDQENPAVPADNMRAHVEGGEHVQGEEIHASGAEEEHAGEHGEAAEHRSREEEESGEKLSLTDTFDHVRNGVRLVLAFHNASSAFIGSVENVTEKTIKNVRVEVHLSNGKELGPTEPRDLAPGEKAGIRIDAAGQVFEWWKAHAESGSSEHGRTSSSN